KAISALLQHSRIPQKEPSTFENFDFSRVTGEHAAQIKSLPNLTALYSRQNIAFTGPPGGGKTHFAYGHFPRPSGPRSPARQGHIKRPVFETGRAEVSSLCQSLLLVVD
ncbi:ATP-binding protein, partial [Porcincola intestinalis]|uniref:ATP-binding protein n=1 Tax=Porcincola intestinalis TaxID=2606632 RepID=UPI002A7F5F1B